MGGTVIFCRGDDVLVARFFLVHLLFSVFPYFSFFNDARQKEDETRIFIEDEMNVVCEPDE